MAFKESDAPTREEIATQIAAAPVGEQRQFVQDWLTDRFEDQEINGRTVVDLLMSDLCSYEEYTDEDE